MHYNVSYLKQNISMLKGAAPPHQHIPLSSFANVALISAHYEAHFASQVH